jgi:hypothetical protein
MQAADTALPPVFALLLRVALVPPICSLLRDVIPSAPPQPIAISEATAVENKFVVQEVDEEPALPVGVASGERTPEISSATQAIFVADVPVQTIEVTPPAMLKES